MKFIATLAALVLGAGVAAADPLEGTWQTVQDDNGHFGHVQVSTCGAALCGTLVRAYDGGGKQIQSANVGRNIIWDTTPAGGGSYTGKVYSPDRDKTYNSKLKLSGDRLKVSGCVLGICRSGGTWARVK